jgi:hypothetical protein
MDQSDVYTYLTNKYKEMNMLDSSNNIVESDSGFDFNIYPDSGYIPTCSICMNDYQTYINNLTHNNMNDNIKMNHISCGCIWFEYYKNKIIGINSKVVFNKK